MYYFDKYYKYLCIFLFIIAVASIILINSLKYIMSDYRACLLCVYQKIPYIFLTIFSIFGFFNVNFKKSTLFIIIVNLIISLFLSGYHSCLLRNILTHNNLCKPILNINNTFFKIKDINSFETLQDIGDINCNSNSKMIYNLFIPEWNFLLNTILIIVIFFYIKSLRIALFKNCIRTK